MSRSDPTPDEVNLALSVSVDDDPWALTRRRFIQGAALGVGLSAMPSYMDHLAAAATPLSSTQGVLVLVVMDGGNDNLDTLVPYGNGRYYDRRGALALRPEQVLRVTSERGFHPNLKHLRSRWDLGEVAVIDGLGTSRLDMSHFSAMASLQAGGPTSGVPKTGWLGRYLDGLGGDPLHGVAIGSRQPLVLTGQSNKVTTLPPAVENVPVKSGDATPVHNALVALGAGSTGLGRYGDLLADTGATMMARASQLKANYPPAGSDPGRLSTHMKLAAKLVNANLGIRVITVRHGGYDNHTHQTTRQNARMAELDEGLKAFNDTLSATFASRTLVLCVTEFGRRIQPNGSGGIDHGAGWSAIAVGRAVRGGVHGWLPSLDALTPEGNLGYSIDYRYLLSFVLSKWLAGDPGQILGVRSVDLGFLRSPGSSNDRSIQTAGFRPEYGDVLRLYRAFFDREPDPSGGNYWIGVWDQTRSLDNIAESFTRSTEFIRMYGGTSNRDFVLRVYRNVLRREPDKAGFDYWLGQLDAGKVTRGTLVRWIASGPEFVAQFPYFARP